MFCLRAGSPTRRAEPACQLLPWAYADHPDLRASRRWRRGSRDRAYRRLLAHWARASARHW